VAGSKSDQVFLEAGKIVAAQQDILSPDLLKTNFFARPIFPFKSFAQTKWPKNQHKN
jgi:hypothetical protein